jgi:hypothetical protein
VKEQTMDTRQHLRDLAISESGFVFDPYSGATYTANATALLVLAELRQGHGRVEIVDRLLADHHVSSRADVERDVDELLGLLHHYQLIDERGA